MWATVHVLPNNIYIFLFYPKIMFEWLRKLQVEVKVFWIKESDRNYACGFPLGGTRTLCNKEDSQVWKKITLAEGYYAQFHPHSSLAELWYWRWSFWGCFVPFSSRPEIFAVLAERPGIEKSRKEDLEVCWGWSDRSICDRWGKWIAQSHMARQSAAGTQICIRPPGDTARTRW